MHGLISREIKLTTDPKPLFILALLYIQQNEHSYTVDFDGFLHLAISLIIATSKFSESCNKIIIS